jgi:hypothetical protein
VLGKELSNPIPEWAEHGADRKAVPYGVATSTDTANPDPGEEYTPRAPEAWPDVVAQPVPAFDIKVVPPDAPLSGLGRALFLGLTRSPKRSARLCPTSRPTRRRQEARR